MHSPDSADAAWDLDTRAGDQRQDAPHFGSWSVDIASGALSTSATCRSLFGRDPAEPFTAEAWRAAVHDDDRARVVASVTHGIATQSDHDLEYRIVTPDGEVRRIRVRAQVANDDDGRPARLSGVCTAVTHRPAQEARRAARAALSDRLSDLDDPAEIAFAAAEILGQALGVSRAGYGTIDPLAETITIERDWNAPGIRSLAGVLHFRDYGSYIDDLKQGATVAFEDAETDPRTARTAAALKAISAQSVVNMPVTEHGGLVALLYVNHATARAWSADDIAFIREFGERTRSAVARRMAEHQLRDLARSLERQVTDRTRERDRTWNNSQDLLLVVDRDGVLRAVNPAWMAVTGRSSAELVGHRLLDFVHPDDRDATASALFAGDPVRLPRLENRMRHSDGTDRWVAWVASPEADLVYASGRHVTAEKEAALELEAAQDQLRQAQKMEAVGQLTGGLAHDFNNLLTGITGSLELLEIRVAQGRAGEIERYVRAAQGAAKRAAALTHRLLAFSRRQTLDPKPVDVNRLVAEMEDLIRRTVGTQIEVEVVGSSGLWTALVDANQLENALLNLCINARDAMPRGGRLTIETANKWLDERAGRERELPPGQYLSLAVSDSGSGMTREIAARAFDPFFTTKPLGAGTGLGLSMVYGFARQSGGQIRIYSEVERGTTMALYLPRHIPGEEAAAQEDEPPPESAPATGKTILIVDDEPTVRMLVREVVHEDGYAAIEAVDGAAALKILRSAARIDLMITDVGLPGGINGRQVADAARVLRPDLKVLFITGFAENAAIGNGFLGPGMRVLTKPFTVVTLARRIHELANS